MQYKSFGRGQEKVLVMHNWFCDNSIYAPLLPHLDPERFTFLFMDLRGYGSAKEIKGSYSLEEVIKDIFLLIQAVQWDRFHVIGHSMSGMVAQKLAMELPLKVKSLVAINPIPASGAKRSPELMTFLESAAIHGGAGAMECIHALTNRRYSDYVAQKMSERWHACSDPKARLAYLHMFSYTDFSDKVQGLKTPMLILFGEHDLEEAAVLHKTFLRWYPNAQVEYCKNAGHFPMQETPLFLASQIEGFLTKNTKPTA